MAKRDFIKRNDIKDEFEQRVIDLARVTRVMAGGKRLRFRACMVVGDKNGRIGYGIAKGADVALAIGKAVSRAKKNIITVPMVNETIPHIIRTKFKSGKVLLKPAPTGTGIIAGGAIRQVLELAGVHNVVAKILGCNNKISNVKAVFKAFEEMKTESGNRKKSKDIIKPTVKKEEKKKFEGRRNSNNPKKDNKKKDK